VQFLSDNTSTACPEILAALAAVNHGRVHSYGDDEWTARLNRCFSDYFGTEVRAFAVATGTAANSLSLATLSPPYGAVFAHRDAHIETDECGAPAFFSGGAQLALLPGAHARIAPETFAQALADHPSVNVGLHSVQPAALSLTQMTEFGTVYRPGELRQLCELAHGRGLKVQMDGARFANAVAFLDCHPSAISWRCGVDVLSFGATKNGALAAEAVVFFDLALVRDFELRRKRAGSSSPTSRPACGSATPSAATRSRNAWRTRPRRRTCCTRSRATRYSCALASSDASACARRASSSTTGGHRTTARRAW
jgi:threonine aldolase